MPGFLILTLKNDIFRLLRMKLAIKLVDPEINHVLVRNLEPLLEKGWMIGPATAPGWAGSSVCLLDPHS
jgi:hypothetical protein